MNRVEAIKVIYEIHGACKSMLISCVSLNQPSSYISETSKGYQIKMTCEMDNFSRNCLRPIVDKYVLEMKEENGFLILN